MSKMMFPEDKYSYLPQGWMYGKTFRLLRDTQIDKSDPSEGTIEAGTIVKVVMCSRFGDVGVTRNLNASGNSVVGEGYETRVNPEDLDPQIGIRLEGNS
jgi:hypothetical protein